MTNRDYSKIILRAVALVVFSSLLGIVYNDLSSEGISLKGNWSNHNLSDSLLVPPLYQSGDPEAVTLQDVMMSFQSKETIFIDARSEYDFRSGHIKGALNLPFYELEQYLPQIKVYLSSDRTIITYCDGIECESSLFLARDLRDRGYKNVKVFFGGWEEWLKAGLPIEGEKGF